MSHRTPAVFGCAGLTLSAGERQFFADARPLGLILFARNIDTPEQVCKLLASFRETVDAPVFMAVDQEGGRVTRLGPPHWRKPPPMAMFAKVPYLPEPFVKLLLGG